MTPATPPPVPVHDLVLRGGRVLDPESGFDAVADVGVTGHSISAVSAEPLTGHQVIEVAGLVVAPGFIDLHSHSHTVAGHRLQALDGVTTALELELGLSPVGEAYRVAAVEGRPLNYGFSASWAQARMAAVGGLPHGGGALAALAHLGAAAWQRQATRAQEDALLGLLERDLADGALGIGLIVGYAPRVRPEEYLAVSRLAAAAGVPTYTHARDLVEQDPETLVDGAEEIARAAGETGVHAHYCHVPSTSHRHADRVLALLERARGEGARVSTEAYPYGAGMTAIGAAFLDPGVLAASGRDVADIVHAATGERPRDLDRLRELRAADPGALAFLHFLDESDAHDRAFLDRALLHPHTVIGSDAMPLTWKDPTADPLAWPLPPGAAVTHPRTAGTFSKTLRRYVRELGALDLMDALARASLLPARVLEAGVPALRRKGRVRTGCDADLVVFDPETVSDRATYADSTRPSTGHAHVLVGGTPVVRHGALLPDALPGRPVRR
ncbi:amidohydrolase family protein [Streptomyces spectabilis]|uniref:amidohydrolase family protein n=1 Tax=Streptomyces spectabilis TaxID=68270 RepID=UPI00186443B3|nr:amidohydrolase family protein [Streptomyces spectabilis]